MVIIHNNHRLKYLWLLKIILLFICVLIALNMRLNFAFEIFIMISLVLESAGKVKTSWLNYLRVLPNFRIIELISWNIGRVFIIL